MGTSHLIAEVEAILYRHDPIDIAFGDNPDEYRTEAASIVAGLRRARSVEHVRALVHAEFVRFFGEDDAGPASRYETVATDIWSLWCATPRKAPDGR